METLDERARCATHPLRGWRTRNTNDFVGELRFGPSQQQAGALVRLSRWWLEQRCAVEQLAGGPVETDSHIELAQQRQAGVILGVLADPLLQRSFEVCDGDANIAG